jgi:hypothetical protein
MRRNHRTRKTVLTGWIMTVLAVLGVGALLAAPTLVEAPVKLDPSHALPARISRSPPMLRC